MAVIHARDPSSTPHLIERGSIVDNDINENATIQWRKINSRGQVRDEDIISLSASKVVGLVSGGVTDHGALTGLSDNDHPQYRLESADHTHQSTGAQGGQLDHGLALTGLADDNHSLYLLASDATNRATFATNWTDLTDGGTTSLHSHAGAGDVVGPASATNDAIVLFDGTTGKLIKNSTSTGTGNPVKQTNPTINSLLTSTFALTLTSPGTSVLRITNTGVSSSTMGAGIQANHNDGAAMGSGDRLGFYLFSGAQDASNTISNSASISGFASAAWSGTSTPSHITFETTPTSSTTRTERFRIGSAGQFGIGGATFGSSGNIFTSGGASAAPTWSAHTGAGVNFGPGAVTSITVVNGHITAIS